MSDIDWVTDLVFDSVGTVLQVRTNDQAIGASIASLTKHFPATQAQSDHEFSVMRRGDLLSVSHGDRTFHQGENPHRALMELLAAMNKSTILDYRSLVVHAGAVARDGHVVVFPASRNVGKSTLVGACLRNGFEYVSDEAVFMISGSNRVHPYPKALWLTETSRVVLGLESGALTAMPGKSLKSPVLPEELGGAVAKGEPMMGQVVLLDRNSDSANMEEVAPSLIAYELLKNSFNRYEQPRRAFLEVSRTVRRTPGWRLQYGDPLEAARYLSANWDLLETSLAESIYGSEGSEGPEGPEGSEPGPEGRG